MDVALGDVPLKKRSQVRPEERLKLAERRKKRKLLKKEKNKMQRTTTPMVVVTGLGKIVNGGKSNVQDARFKIKNKQTGFDARFKIDARTKIDARSKINTDARSKIDARKTAFDARTKIAAKSNKTFDARQKIIFRNRQQEPEIIIPKVTITSGAFADDGDTADPLSFRKTIQNEIASTRDLVITTKQAVKRRPSPIRGPMIAAKQPRPQPIRPQAGVAQQGNVIRLPKSNRMAQSKPQHPVQPREKVPQLALQTHSQALPRNSSASSSSPAGYRLLISNLSNTVTQDDILELYGSLGAIKRARIVRPGTAEVLYVQKEDAEAAIAQYHLRELDGQPMRVVLVQNAPSQAPAPKPVAPKQPVTPKLQASPEGAGPLRLSKGVPPKKMDIDPGLIHSALFKSKEKRSGKPVSFSITI